MSATTTPKRTPKKRQATEIDHSQDETKEETPQWLVDKNEHKKKSQQEKRNDGNNDALKVREEDLQATLDKAIHTRDMIKLTQEFVLKEIRDLTNVEIAKIMKVIIFIGEELVSTAEYVLDNLDTNGIEKVLHDMIGVTRTKYFLRDQMYLQECYFNGFIFTLNGRINPKQPKTTPEKKETKFIDF